MKPRVLFIVLLGLVISIYVVSNHSVTKVTPQEDAIEEFSKGFYSGSHYGITQDGVPCTVSYGWHINHTINEDEYLKIDLLLKRTIAKSISEYKREQITKIPSDFTTDFKSRLEDAVFAIEPTGFIITHVFVTIKKSTL